MIKLAKKTYKKLKTVPIIGKILQVLRRFIYVPLIQKPSLKKRDINEAYKVLEILFGRSALRYLSEIKKSKVFRRRFSFGHSGNYDSMILYSLIRAVKAEVVVEMGVASGRSSAVILEALHRNNNGKLYSIDLPRFYKGRRPQRYVAVEEREEFCGFIPRGQQSGWLIPQHLRGRWKLILGDSKVKLPKLAKFLGKIDVFYHDSDHSYKTMMFEYRTVWPYLSEKGFLLSDDIKWNNAFDDFVKSVQSDFVHKYRGMGILRKK